MSLTRLRQKVFIKVLYYHVKRLLLLKLSYLETIHWSCWYPWENWEAWWLNISPPDSSLTGEFKVQRSKRPSRSLSSYLGIKVGLGRQPFHFFLVFLVQPNLFCSVLFTALFRLLRTAWSKVYLTSVCFFVVYTSEERILFWQVCARRFIY